MPGRKVSPLLVFHLAQVCLGVKIKSWVNVFQLNEDSLDLAGAGDRWSAERKCFPPGFTCCIAIYFGGAAATYTLTNVFSHGGNHNIEKYLWRFRATLPIGQCASSQ